MNEGSSGYFLGNLGFPEIEISPQIFVLMLFDGSVRQGGQLPSCFLSFPSFHVVERGRPPLSLLSL